MLGKNINAPVGILNRSQTMARDDQESTYLTSFALLTPLAEQGDARAQHKLATMYRDGRGVTKDETRAVELFRMAAEAGYVPAQLNLGVMYRAGKGVPADSEEALRWYRLAADNHNAVAQYNLGVFYATGKGVERDLVQAHVWFSLACQHSRPGDEVFGKATKNRILAEQMMSQQAIDEAERIAAEWRPAMGGSSSGAPAENAPVSNGAALSPPK